MTTAFLSTGLVRQLFEVSKSGYSSVLFCASCETQVVNLWLKAKGPTCVPRSRDI